MNNFKDKKILIFGLGLNQGGVGSAKFFARQGAEVRVTDLKPKDILKPSLEELKDFPDIEYTLGEHRNEDIMWADIIIKNPAVKPGNSYIEYTYKIGKSVETDMGIFLQFVSPQQIIGVTGTKGKSTVSSLIYEVLKNAGKDVVFAGNIGISVLDTVPSIKENTLVVLEISSFQLESFNEHKVSPKWAAVTNIYPDHLNYYQAIEEYIEAKKIITKYQTGNDFLFIRKGDEVTSKREFLSGTKSQIIYFSSGDLPKDYQPALPGEHNRENLAAALAISKTLGVEEKQALEIMKDFKGIEFRLQLVKDVDGIKIYNDTAATSPESGIHAIKTFPGCILICGGMNKKMDYSEYTKVVSENVKEVFFLEGDSTAEIQKLLKNTSQTYNDLERLLTDVKKIAEPGDIILFSPAATSFNLFQNEFDRGRKFNQAVERVFG